MVKAMVLLLGVTAMSAPMAAQNDCAADLMDMLTGTLKLATAVEYAEGGNEQGMIKTCMLAERDNGVFISAVPQGQIGRSKLDLILLSAHHVVRERCGAYCA